MQRPPIRIGPQPAGQWYLVAMILLQVTWVSLIGWTRSTLNLAALPWLLGYTLLVGGAILFLPARLVRPLHALGQAMRAHPRRALAAICLLFLIGGLWYAARQRTWTYDEQQSYNASQRLAAEGVGAFLAHYGETPWLGRQHPPLVPLANGIVLRGEGDSLWHARLLGIAAGVGLLLATYSVGRALYDPVTGMVGALLLTTFTLVGRLSSTAMTDVPVTFFFTLLLACLLRLRRAPSYPLLLGAGLVFGMGLLTKYTMILVVPVGALWWLLDPALRQRWAWLLGIGSIGGFMLGGWLLILYRLGILQAQQETLVGYAGVVANTGYGQRLLLETLTTRLPSSIGVYHLPLLAVGGLLALRRRAPADLLLLGWIGTVALILFSTLPDHRYFMPLFPALALMIARAVRHLAAGREKVILLAVLYNMGALYLFMDWERSSRLFLR